VRYKALACDYDGTLAEDGAIAPAVRAALARLRGAGVAVVLVTGRRLDDLERACPDARALFDRIVAENGGVYLRPPAGTPRRLGPRPPPALFACLQERGVEPLVAGEVVVATLVTQETEVEAAIRASGLDWRMILNKTALMLLPAGVDKGSGVAVALADLGISPRDAVGIGDGENDLPLLARCGRAVAVATAVPDLKAAADLVTRGGAGAGVAEVADAMRAGDEAALGAVNVSAARS
jgi:hydroxymethylpyrimidine pyrophosphatase-like HAD family hydrolase